MSMPCCPKIQIVIIIIMNATKNVVLLNTDFTSKAPGIMWIVQFFIIIIIFFKFIIKLANPSLLLLLTKNYSFLKQKTRERKLLCCQINQSRALFSFPSCAWYISPNHGTCLCKRTSPQVPIASSMECLNALLICKLSVKALGWLFA